ncbi:uncharacterized protein UTRI_03288_B [Ustilago trichophora]|uniref:Uncharacterized protein n=1 Tax=Ustilago trichophora TaxID=86804 RepID=A0A5C3E662_9BASI|nr:uncharacterized protein UTRI_03288_B [Ustilago trichophora]
MSASSAAKGKARALDADIDSTTNTTQSAPRFVKPQSIPSTTLLNIEYPGILSDDVIASTSSSSPSSQASTSLERALSTLHPSALPPLTSSPHEGLNFLAKILNEGIKVIECRLGAYASAPAAERTDDGIDQVYRAPLIGEVVPTHNIVVRIVRRTWRQKRKRKRGSAEESTQSEHASAQEEEMALDPALFAEADLDLHQPQSEQRNGTGEDVQQNKRSRYTGRIKKEYCIEILGMATNTVRFRSMADFAFQPNISTCSSSAESQLDPVMALHKALATMDLAAFQQFRIPRQLEDYRISHPDGSTQSNLHMVPPAFFSRMDVPFNYAFQQTPYSELRNVPTPTHLTTRPSTSASFAHALKRSDLQPGQMQRFVNRVRLSNIAPQPFRVGRDTKVPTKPLQDVVRIEHRCEPKVLARLRELLLERPMWSRVALKNQLSEAELNEVHGNNEKVYYALVGYSMVGGPWRDTIVRFGYDVRTDASSRIYQRIFLRGGPVGRESRLQGQASRGGGVGVGVGGLIEDLAVEEEEEEAPLSRSSVLPLPGGGGKRTRTTHLFDGTTLHRHVGNFQLCDVEDPLIKPYIWRTNDEDLPQHSILALQPIGIQWLRETYDAETGWYSRRALELIRALVTARFKALLDSGKPLEEEALGKIVERVRNRWREEDAASATAADVGAETQTEAVQSGVADIDPSLM